jgi:hypothetical protein
MSKGDTEVGRHQTGALSDFGGDCCQRTRLENESCYLLIKMTHRRVLELRTLTEDTPAPGDLFCSAGRLLHASLPDRSTLGSAGSGIFT